LLRLRIVVFALACAALAAQAQPRRENLESLRGRIEALQQELERKEGAKREARDALRDSERAISQANRALASIEAESRRLRAESARIAERRKTLERTAGEREAALGRMLAARQAAGAPDALRVALSGDDPAALARNLYYLGYVSRAAAALLLDYRAGIAEAERLAREADTRRARLRTLEQASRTDRARVVKERRERRQVLDRVAVDIRKNRRDIKQLQADESRLARLVQEIGRVVYGRVEQTPEAAARTEPFATLRGKLRLPVRGELTGRFGAPRGAGGIEAKGVFIRAPQGQPVKAVAQGQVVYADWMRGFGNLLIVDHGQSYLSIYANNESLLKQVGENVTSGETLAVTGASGGNEETGLYFELRHLGRAFDPLRWVRLK
jgi:septal ring factor EnvC (AmiA/AmiB activator)